MNYESLYGSEVPSDIRSLYLGQTKTPANPIGDEGTKLIVQVLKHNHTVLKQLDARSKSSYS